MRQLKTAIIGTGFIGPAHLEALRRIGGVEVVALASQETEKANALAAQFAIPKVYADWSQVVADPAVEVIHNCTPNNLHFAINEAALKAGKHVVCEKPLTMTSTESAELVRLADEAGVVHAIVYNYRFYPLIQHAREMVRRGDVGNVLLVHGHYLQDWLFYATDYNWRIDPEVSGASRAMGDIGSHWFDLVQYITGLRVTEVCADLVTIHKTRRKPLASADTFKGVGAAMNTGEDVRISTEDAGGVLCRFENGALGVFSVSQVSAGRKNWQWFEIDGSTKAISWNQEEPNVLWIGKREAPNEVLIKDPSLLHDKARPYAHYPGGHPEGYPDAPKNLFRDIYEFIRSGKDPRRTLPSFPTFKDGHHGMRLIEAVVSSSKTRRWMMV
jgi:predicted dehydrogenase